MYELAFWVSITLLELCPGLKEKLQNSFLSSSNIYWGCSVRTLLEAETFCCYTAWYKTLVL